MAVVSVVFGYTMLGRPVGQDRLDCCQIKPLSRPIRLFEYDPHPKF
jgi:hypothetical protein